MNELMALKSLGNFPLATSTILPILRDYRRPYDKINYWVKSGNLVQVKKGLYVLGQEISNQNPHPFLLANQIYGPSYVSLDSALSHFGLIPERVYQTSSVTTRLSKTFITPLGRFDYTQVKSSYFTMGIKNQGSTEAGYYLIASPEKAIWDKVVLTSGVIFRSKVEVRQFLEEDLRVDEIGLAEMNLEIIEQWIPFSPKKTSLKLLIETLQEL
jgi:hypothetical protein